MVVSVESSQQHSRRANSVASHVRGRYSDSMTVTAAEAAAAAGLISKASHHSMMDGWVGGDTVDARVSSR